MYCLKPEDCRKFFEFIKQTNIPEEYKEKFYNAEIEKVEINIVSQTQGTWKIYIKAEQFIPDVLLKVVENNLKNHVGLSEVSFVFSAASSDLSPDIPSDVFSDIEIHPDFRTPEYLKALAANLAPQKTKKKSNQVIFGRGINASDVTLPIKEVREEARNIIIEGSILNFDAKELKSGRFLLTFDLVDSTDGISVKIFFEKQEQFKRTAEQIENNIYVKVKGSILFDKFVKELVMFAESIRLIEKPERFDNAEIRRIELHAHTQLSVLDAVVSVEKLIETAAKWKHPAIAITDHGVVQAFPKAAEIAAKEGIKIIYGMEGYLFDEDINKAHHIIILAKNKTGLHNLYRLVSLSHLKYFHRTPRLPRTALNKYRDGLILGSACEAGELIQSILNDLPEEELLKIASYYDYLEIQPAANNNFLIRSEKVADYAALENINKKVCDLAVRLKKLVVATCDVHFLNPEDEVYRRVLMSGKGYEDADFQPPLFFRTTGEMLEEFSYLGEKLAYEVVVENPHRINDLIEVIKPIPDELYAPQIPGAEEEVREMSYKTAKNLYGDNLPDIVSERLNYELDAIINNGFAVLYLIAQKLVKKSMDDGYLVGSRGSVGSSFVATMTGITEVNPLPPHWRCPQCRHSQFITDGSFGSGFDLPDKECPQCGALLDKDGHDIPFAVFMGFHGDKVPDIDLNFSGDYQPSAHKYTEELFGRDNVFRAGTISTIKEKKAFGFAKNYLEGKSIIARGAYINHLVAGCVGAKQTTGQHPGGIMVVPRDMDIHHFTPIQYPADDKRSSTITTHFDYKSISSRLVKLDLLGHDDPTVIKMLEDLTGIDAKKIPFDDVETMSLFSSTDALGLKPEEVGSTVGTFGVPEFGTEFVRQMLEDTKPTKFSELLQISGLSHGENVWLNNAQDLIKNGVAKLSETICTRDDIMVYLMQKGVEPQTAFKVMEDVRKGKGVKSEYVAKLKERDVPDWYIDSCQKIQYMFPKAHAVAYVMMAYRIAYCKVHYPPAFYASYFTVRADDFDTDIISGGKSFIKKKLAEFEQKGNTLTAKEKSLQTIFETAHEMYLRGFVFEKLDLYKSDAVKFLITNAGLLPPLVSLAGFGPGAAKHLATVREDRPFSSIEDLRIRGKVSKTIIEILKNIGCVDGLAEIDQTSLF